jgi:hypothetical protein
VHHRANGKNLQSEKFQLFFFTPLFRVVELTPSANLPLLSLTPMANLLPVSTAPEVLVEKFAPVVVDTGGKFAAGVVDIYGAH